MHTRAAAASTEKHCHIQWVQSFTPDQSLLYLLCIDTGCTEDLETMDLHKNPWFNSLYWCCPSLMENQQALICSCSRMKNVIHRWNLQWSVAPSVFHVCCPWLHRWNKWVHAQIKPCRGAVCQAVYVLWAWGATDQAANVNIDCDQSDRQCAVV